MHRTKTNNTNHHLSYFQSFFILELAFNPNFVLTLNFRVPQNFVRAKKEEEVLS